VNALVDPHRTNGHRLGGFFNYLPWFPSTVSGRNLPFQIKRLQCLTILQSSTPADIADWAPILTNTFPQHDLPSCPVIAFSETATN